MQEQAARGGSPLVHRGSHADNDTERARSSQYLAWLPLTAGVLWGTAFPAISLALEGFRPGPVAFWRGVLGAATLGVWLLARRSLRLPVGAGAWVRISILALAGAGFFWSAQSVAVRLSNPVNVAFLVALYPAVIAAMAPVLLGETLRRRNVLALACALTGAYLVITRGALLSLFAAETLPGDLLAVLAAASFGAYILLTRRWQDRLALSSEGTTFYTFLLSLPALALLALADGGFGGRLTLQTGGALLWLGIACSTVAFLALNRAIRAGALTRTGLHIMASPVVAALVSWPLFGLTLEPVQWLGGALVLLGIALAQR